MGAGQSSTDKKAGSPLEKDAADLIKDLDAIIDKLKKFKKPEEKPPAETNDSTTTTATETPEKKADAGGRRSKKRAHQSSKRNSNHRSTRSLRLI